MDSLQFQKAEFEDPRPKCAACRNPVEGSYFGLAGRTVCTRCAEVLRDRQAQPRGPAILRGFLYGLGAALGCAVVFAVVRLATEACGPLLLIAFGYIVGRAAQIGSGGLGGRPCQILAVALTFLSMLSTGFQGIVFLAVVPVGLVLAWRETAYDLCALTGPYAFPGALPSPGALPLRSHSQNSEGQTVV